MEIYDPLAELLQLAAESCYKSGKPTKAIMLMNLRTVLGEEPELSRELLRRMAQRLMGVEVVSRTHS